jgi:hypothetical protein
VLRYVVIASEAKQSSARKERLDCFVVMLLAMTGVNEEPVARRVSTSAFVDAKSEKAAIPDRVEGWPQVISSGGLR